MWFVCQHSISADKKEHTVLSVVKSKQEDTGTTVVQVNYSVGASVLFIGRCQTAGFYVVKDVTGKLRTAVAANEIRQKCV